MSERFSVYFVSVLLLALGIAAAIVHTPGFSPSATLEFWRPDAEFRHRLEQFEEQRLQHLPAVSEFEALSAALMELNLASAPGAEPLSARHLNWLNSRFRGEVAAFVAKHGEKGFVALGTYMARNFRGRLKTVAKGLAAAQDESAADWIANHNDDADIHAARALSGQFLEKALGAGILRAGAGTDEDQLLVAGLLWLQRWLQLAGPSARVQALAGDELALVLKWKVEAAEHLPLKRRIELCNVVTDLDPDYPGHFVQGIVYATAGRRAEAEASFTASLQAGEEMPAAEDWLLFLRRQEETP